MTQSTTTDRAPRATTAGPRAGSVLERLPGLGWVEGATVAGGCRPVVSWNGTDACVVGEARSALAAPEPLWPFDSPNQTAPVARGRRIAFFAEHPGAGNALGLHVAGLDGERWTAPVATTTVGRSVAWLDDGHLITVDTGDDGAHLVAVPVGSPSAPERLLRLSEGPRWTDPSPDVGPDGRVLLIVEGQEGPSLAVLDPSDRTVTTLLRPKKGAVPTAARWSPDGRKVAALVRRPSGLHGVVLDLHAGSMHAVPGLLGGLPAWSADGRLAVPVDAWPAVQVAVVDPVTGDGGPIGAPDGLLTTAPDWADGRWWVVGHGPDQAPTLLSTDGASWERHTPGQQLLGGRRPSVLRVPAPEGFDIPVLLYEPVVPRPDGAAALMLHGGPSASWRSGWDPVVCALLDAGYRVALADLRGSTFRAWPLPPLGPREFGVADVADAGACLDALQAGGAPVVVFGHSHGAFVAYRTTLRHAGRVAAAVLTSGYLHPSDLLASPDPDVERFRRFAFGPGDETRPDRLPASCPLFLVHGEHDAHMPADVLADAAGRLEPRGHELMVLAGEGHAYRRRANVVRWLARAVEFCDEAVGGGR